jgi:hypothetical protein
VKVRTFVFALFAAAVVIAGGDAGRVVVIDESTAIIRNVAGQPGPAEPAARRGRQ